MSQQPIGWVPPGVPGNASGAAIPLYAPPPTVISEETRQAIAAAAAARQARVDELARIADPIERLIRAVAAFVDVKDHEVEGRGGRRMRLPWTMGAPAAEVSQLCPGWNDSCTEVGQYDDDAVASWFAQAARTAGVAPDAVVRWPEPRRRKITHKVLVGPGDVVATMAGEQADAWVIPAALLDWHPSALRTSDALIAVDGRLYRGHRWDRSVRPPRLECAGRLTVAALIYLASRLGCDVRWHSAVPLGRPAHG